MPEFDRTRLSRIAHDVMLQRGLEPDFPADSLAQLAAISGPGTASAPGIRDLRGLLWASIDNDDSRDLDQLSVARDAGNGATTILVAIADVDALVKKDTAIDAHARTNTTSVYTAGGIFAMLPERLSTDLTSLGEDAERLAIVIEFTVATDGTLADGEIYRAIVTNRAKLAYASVAAWLEGTGPAPARVATVPGIDEQLRLQDRVAQAMSRVRHQQGALRLETLEARPVFDGSALIDMLPDERNRAKELIEDFMVAANGVTARFLERKGFSSLRRILRAPKRWDRIVELAATLSERLPAEPSAAALDAFLAARRKMDPEHFPDLSLSVVKLLGSGEYALERPGHDGEGHFGLAVRDYTHSTAPNRRFPDVITQRLLKAALAGQPTPYSDAELEALAAHCTQQEDNAAKVERQVRKSAAALLLMPRIGQQFDGIVTGRSDKGTFVRITAPMAEGRVTRGEGGLDVGDRVRVTLIHTDVERGYIDFARAGGAR